MIKFCNLIIFSNLFISICAFSLCLFNLHRYQKETSWELPLFVMGSVFLCYNLLRVYPNLKELRIKEDFTQFFLAHRTFMNIMLAATALSCLFGLIRLSPSQILIIICASLISIFYEKIFISFSLREVPFIKCFLVSLCWTLMTVALPGIHSLIAYGETFIFILLLTLAFDLHDIKSDEKQHIKTFASQQESTLRFMLVLAMGLFCFFLYVELGESMSFVLWLIYCYLLYTPKVARVLFHMGVDGLILARCLFHLI